MELILFSCQLEDIPCEEKEAIILNYNQGLVEHCIDNPFTSLTHSENSEWNDVDVKNDFKARYTEDVKIFNDRSLTILNIFTSCLCKLRNNQSQNACGKSSDVRPDSIEDMISDINRYYLDRHSRNLWDTANLANNLVKRFLKIMNSQKSYNKSYSEPSSYKQFKRKQISTFEITNLNSPSNVSKLVHSLVKAHIKNQKNNSLDSIAINCDDSSRLVNFFITAISDLSVYRLVILPADVDTYENFGHTLSIVGDKKLTASLFKRESKRHSEWALKMEFSYLENLIIHLNNAEKVVFIDHWFNVVSRPANYMLAVIDKLHKWQGEGKCVIANYGTPMSNETVLDFLNKPRRIHITCDYSREQLEHDQILATPEKLLPRAKKVTAKLIMRCWTPLNSLKLMKQMFRLLYDTPHRLLATNPYADHLVGVITVSMKKQVRFPIGCQSHLQYAP